MYSCNENSREELSEYVKIKLDRICSYRKITKSLFISKSSTQILKSDWLFMYLNTSDRFEVYL